MSAPAVRGNGVGIEISDSVVRGVRLRHDVGGRVAAATEFATNLADDNATLDALVLVRADLGDPDDPVRIATFPDGAMLQRMDVTGRSGPQLNELRSRLDRLHDINSTVIVDDGPRRYLLLIRWDAAAVRRIEALAERAGFVDVTIEPTPLALARVAGPDATFVRRLVAHADAIRMVLQNRLPVAATGTNLFGRPHPDLDVTSVDVPMAYFDDFMSDPSLGEVMDRLEERIGAGDAAPSDDDTDGAPIARPELDLVGDVYPPFPPSDRRSPERQAVALGAAVGAAGLAGPLRPVDMIISDVAADDQFDRPWAIEALSPLDEVVPAGAVSGVRRLTSRFRSRRR